MSDKSYFKFGLYIKNPNSGHQIVSERIFPAGVYNQPTRYTVNIKPMSHEIISSFQKVLSTRPKFLTMKTYLGKNLNGKGVVVNHDKQDYNFDFPQDLSEAFCYRLMINDNIIIERDFSVNRFNPKAIFSNEIMDLVNDWVETINKHIKKADEIQMWQEMALIENYGMQVSEIRTMDKEKKDYMLRKINFN
jgi:hypothetical protein